MNVVRAVFATQHPICPLAGVWLSVSQHQVQRLLALSFGRKWRSTISLEQSIDDSTFILICHQLVTFKKRYACTKSPTVTDSPPDVLGDKLQKNTIRSKIINFWRKQMIGHSGILRYYGAVHKVCHAFFDDFWPPLPLSQTVTNLGPP